LTVHIWHPGETYTVLHPRSLEEQSQSQFPGKVSRSGTLRPLLASIPLSIQGNDFCDCSSKDRGGYSTQIVFLFKSRLFICHEPLHLALPQSMWAHQFGGPRLDSAPKLPNLYRERRLSTLEQSVNAREAALEYDAPTPSCSTCVS
jgi:hypothetical protein